MKKNISNKIFMILTINLILFDQIIKLFIHHYHMEKVFTIIPKIFTFSPMQNKSYSYVGALFGNFFSNYGFNILTRVLMAYIIIRTLFYIKDRNIKIGNIAKLAISFLMAGLICSTIDVLIWKGSIDFIGLFNWFVFDTKDVYLSTFVAISVISIIFFGEEWDKIDLKDWEKYLLFLKNKK